MKKTAIILLCAALGLASGCGSQDNGDAEQALENVAEETTAEETFPGPVSAGLESLEGFDEDAWALYEKGVAAMNALTSREEQFIVNTVQEENGTSTEESVNVRLKDLAVTVRSSLRPVMWRPAVRIFLWTCTIRMAYSTQSAEMRR